MFIINKLREDPVVDFAALELKKYLRMMMLDCGEIKISYDPAAKSGFRLGLLEDFQLPFTGEDADFDDEVYIDTDAQGGIDSISRRSWIFLILSGLATGASWICYYKALQLGDASKVVPIDKLSVVFTLIMAFVFLHEKFTAKSLIGCILIAAGTLVMVF